MVTSGVNNSLSQSELLQLKATQVVNRQTGIGSGNLGSHQYLQPYLDCLMKDTVCHIFNNILLVEKYY